jgi:hypothetical protein
VVTNDFYQTDPPKNKNSELPAALISTITLDTRDGIIEFILGAFVSKHIVALGMDLREISEFLYDLEKLLT